MNVPPRIDRAVAIAHIEAVRDAAQAADIGMFGSAGSVQPESFESRVGLAPDIAAGLRDLYHIANGIRCGAVFFYAGRRISAEETSFTALLPEGPVRWQDFALLDDVPVFIDRTDGSIWHSPAAIFQGVGDLPLQLIAPDVLTFAAWIVMGPGYAEIVGAEDDWSEFLREHGFLDLENPE